MDYFLVVSVRDQGVRCLVDMRENLLLEPYAINTGVIFAHNYPSLDYSQSGKLSGTPVAFG